jgi:hypothetical protein
LDEIFYQQKIGTRDRIPETNKIGHFQTREIKKLEFFSEEILLRD